MEFQPLRQFLSLSCGLFILVAMPVRAQAPSLSAPAAEISEFGAWKVMGGSGTSRPGCGTW
jgi:hypothetical protein